MLFGPKVQGHEANHAVIHGFDTPSATLPKRLLNTSCATGQLLHEASLLRRKEQDNNGYFDRLSAGSEDSGLVPYQRDSCTLGKKTHRRARRERRDFSDILSVLCGLRGYVSCLVPACPG